MLTIYRNEECRTVTLFLCVDIFSLGSELGSIVPAHLSAQYNKLVVKAQVMMLNAIHNHTSIQHVAPYDCRSGVAF